MDDDHWHAVVDMITAFVEHHRRLPSEKAESIVERRLSIWLRERKREDRANALTSEQSDLLAQQPWYRRGRSGPNPAQKQRWLRNLAEVDTFAVQHRRLPSVESTDSEEVRLGVWISTQRDENRKQLLSADRLATLQMTEWWNDPRFGLGRGAWHGSWQKRLAEVVEFVDEHGFLPPGRDDRRVKWVQSQITALRAGTLLPERQEQLERLWWWSFRTQTTPAGWQPPTMPPPTPRPATSIEHDADPGDLTEARTNRALPAESEWRHQDQIQCLECGEWKKALGKHLRSAHSLSAAQYRALWGMRQRQPLTCGAVSEERRQIAIRSGGPERLTAWAPIVADAAHEAAQRREHRPQERAANSSQSSTLREKNRRAAAERIARADEAIADAGFESREAWLREHYVRREMTLRECDKALDVGHSTCQRWMEESGIPRRRTGPRPQSPA